MKDTDTLSKKYGLLLLLMLLYGIFSGFSPAAVGAQLADKSETVRVQGLHHPVTIVRDHAGIAHIYAQTTGDLFFAQGYNVARDRLWQIDLWRRMGEGKLAEQFGARFIQRDRAARLFLYRGDLEKEYESYHPETRQILQAFADGINTYIQQAMNDPKKMPPEFRLTGTLPGHWDITTPLIRLFTISRNLKQEVQLAREIHAVGVKKAAEMNVFEPALADLSVPAGVDLALITPEILNTYNEARRAPVFTASDFPNSPLTRPALAKVLAMINDSARSPVGIGQASDTAEYESNNWVVNGQHTQSGKPLLANDPHRQISTPSLRYMVHLNAPGWNVIGAGEPALPGVSLGHNDHIAFGLTIFPFGDEEDLYVYDTRDDKGDEYRYQGRWERMRKRDITIAVRGQAASTQEMLFTRHGPVLYQDRKHHKAYALRAAYLEYPGTAPYLASLRIDQANNWDQFVQGMNRHYMPGENMVYADREGNIGWFGGALVPQRRRPDWSGMLPVAGDGRYEWDGILSGDALPRVLNPPSGRIATANAYNLPAHYPHIASAAHDWAEPYRLERIHQMLSGEHRFTRQDMAHFQYDDLSLPSLHFVRFAQRLSSSDPGVQRSLRALASWDGIISQDSATATLYELWVHEIATRLTQRLLPESAQGLFPALQMRQVMTILEHPDARLGTSPEQARDMLLMDSLTAAIARGTKRLGSQMDQWQWSRLHHADFSPPLAEIFPFLKQYVPQTYAVSGDNDTVHRGTYDAKSFQLRHGATYRQIIDLSDWDTSLVQNAPGQSGDVRSPFFANLIKGWATGQYAPMVFSDRAVQAQKSETLILLPASAREARLSLTPGVSADP